MHELLLEPLKYYDTVGKSLHEENSEKHFADLVEKSHVNIEENRETVKRYKAELEIIDGLSKVISKFKALRALLIFGIVVGVILTIFSFYLFSEADSTGGILLPIGATLIVICILIMVKKVNPKIRDTDAVRDEHIRKSEEILSEAWAQMASLNALFKDDDALRLIEKTINEFDFEDRLVLEPYKEVKL